MLLRGGRVMPMRVLVNMLFVCESKMYIDLPNDPELLNCFKLFINNSFISLLVEVAGDNLYRLKQKI